MDRISDSGSDGCGSIPHGGTRTGRIDATCSCLSPSHFVTAPGGMPSLPLVVPGDLFAFPYFASKIPGPVARLMAQSLRSELSPSHFVTAPGGHAVTPFGRSGRPIRLSIFCGQNTRPGRAPDGGVASLRIVPQSLRDSPRGYVDMKKPLRITSERFFVEIVVL